MPQWKPCISYKPLCFLTQATPFLPLKFLAFLHTKHKNKQTKFLKLFKRYLPSTSSSNNIQFISIIFWFQNQNLFQISLLLLSVANQEVYVWTHHDTDLTQSHAHAGPFYPSNVISSQFPHPSPSPSHEDNQHFLEQKQALFPNLWLPEGMVGRER